MRSASLAPSVECGSKFRSAHNPLPAGSTRTVRSLLTLLSSPLLSAVLPSPNHCVPLTAVLLAFSPASPMA